MKKTIYVLLILICVMFSYADVSVDMDIDSQGGNANVDVDVDSQGGDVDVRIDGVGWNDTLINIDKTFTEVRQSQNEDINNRMTIGYIFNQFTKSLGIEFDYSNKDYKIVKPEDNNMFMRVFYNALTIRFVTRYEYDKLYNKLQQQSYEIMALQKLFDEEELCNARLEVAKEQNIKTVKCGDITYYNEENKFIGLEKKQVENKKIQDINEIKVRDVFNATQKYQDLCDKGIKKFCLVLEK